MKKKKVFISLILLLSISLLIACTNKLPVDVDDDITKYQITNGGFETGDLSGWTVISGNAFSVTGVTNDDYFNSTISYDKDGEYLYGAYDEKLTGSMRSESFIIGGSCYISFKLGSGKNMALTYISIVNVENDVELFRFGNSEFNSGEGREANLVSYYANLSLHEGKTAYILVVDNSTANWGFLTLDSFVTYYEEKPNLEEGNLAKNIMPLFTDSLVTPNILYNGDFRTGTLEGWTVIGDENSFLDSHINANFRLSNRPNETSVGVLRSSAFKVGGLNIMSFRLGATKNKELTYLSVKKVGTNEEIFRTYSNRWRDAHEENTHLYYIDLRDYAGDCLYIEIVDNSRGDWGLVTVENINTFYQERPFVTDEIAVNILNEVNTNPQYTNMRNFINPIINSIEDETSRITLQKTFYATIDGIQNIKGSWPSVLIYNADGTTFVYTGDIPAMWLRDSAAQVLPYLQFMTIDEDVRLMVRGLLLKQFEQIRRDPYANAFNQDGSVWERKFEIDSLCYPIWLAWEYYTITNDDSIFDIFFEMTIDTILDTFSAEQNHSDDNYRIEIPHDRAAGPHEVNVNSRLIWSGYRPSDDVNYYKFYIPGNMFAVATLEKVYELYNILGRNQQVANRALDMANEVRNAIETYAVYNHPTHGKIYAFEVNGFNSDPNSSEGKLLMDIANIPSLISAPWLGYCDIDDPVYQNTRRFTLSFDNPYYYEGTYAKGIGDPHDMVSHGPGVQNPHPHVPVPWHMALAMQGLTTNDMDEILLMVKYQTDTTGGTYVMHEAFNANDPTNYSRDWFTWPCALYAQLVITKVLGVNLLEGE